MQRKTKLAAGAVDAVIGQRLRTLRTARNLSQEKLGKAVGLTFQQIQKYESGANKISIATLLDICAHLGCHIDYFIEGLGAKADPAPVMPAGVQRAMGQLCRMADGPRKAMLRMIGDFSKGASHAG